MTPPSQIAHYRIVSKLGEGGMGAVYRATDTKLNRDVAIKILPDSFANDPDRLARFTREAQVLASLNHPNIAAIYGVEDRALILELVEGEDLKGPLPAATAIDYAHQMAEALEYAHEKGIIHRDLKPANIKVTPEGRVKLLDFGLAKALSGELSAADPSSSPTLTMRATLAGVIIGTAAYMSPEQAHGREADRRADIWSFGVVLYEMLTGRSAFSGESISDTLASVLKFEPDWTALPPDTPTSVRRLLRQCLKKDRRQRLQAIGDARISLEEAEPEAAPATVNPAPPPSRPSSMLSWALAGILAVCALAFAVLWWRRPVEERPVIRFSIRAPENSTIANAPAISPDGRRVVFAVFRENQPQFWIRDLESTLARPLAGTEGATSPFWSPDSRFLAFVQNGKVKRMDVAGGPAQTVCDSSTLGSGGSWGPGDVILIGNPQTRGIARVAAAGGTPSPVTDPDASRHESFHGLPFFLPDGRHFLYVAQAGGGADRSVWIGDLASKDHRLLIKEAQMAAYDPRGYILFSLDNSILAQPFDAGRLETTGDPFPIAEGMYRGNGRRFSVSSNGVLVYLEGGASEGNQELAWFDRSGKPLGTVGPRGEMWSAAISPDGTKIAADRAESGTGVFDVWLHDVVHSTDSRFTFDPKTDWYPAWSPDGAHIAFCSNRTGQWGVYLKSSSGTGKEELLFESPGMKFSTAWSHDAKFLIFTSLEATTQRDIWVVPNPLGGPGSRKPYPFVHSEAHEDQGVLSPDGKYLAYMSDENRTTQVYVQSFPGGEGKFQISTNGGNRPVWSRDGKELFYIASDQKMMAVEVKTAGGFQHGLLFETHTRDNTVFDVAPDGKRFLLVQTVRESDGPSLSVIVNWHPGLKR